MANGAAEEATAAPTPGVSLTEHRHRIARIDARLAELNGAVDAIAVLAEVAAEAPGDTGRAAGEASAVEGLSWAARHLRQGLDALHRDLRAVDGEASL